MKPFLRVFRPFPFVRHRTGKPVPTGSVEVTGHIHKPQHVPKQLALQKPAVVLRLASSGSVEGVYPINQPAKTVPCWLTPTGCPHKEVADDLPFGEYTASIEIPPAKTWRPLPGEAKPRSLVLARYAVPGKRVSVITINARNPHQSITLGF